VVIETSGVALPFDTQLNFWREPVCRWIGDDMAVVVVNAEQVVEGRDLEGTFSDQVTSADLIVLNKVDLVSDDALARARETLREIEPEAPVLLATQGDVPSELLFPPGFLETAPDRSGPAPAPRPHSHEHFETEVWQVPDALDEEAIRTHLAQPGLLRAKGFVRTPAGIQLVQVVGRRIEIQPGEEPISPELVGRIVLIRRAA